MDSDSLFRFLEAANVRPAVFSKYTARDLWTDEHTSRQMLAYHLNEDVDVSSRRGAFIDESTRWMVARFNLSAGSRIADFGCGPGLYSCRLARLQANVVGIDFSSRSIAYARESGSADGLSVTFVEADYLEYQPEGKFDLIIMIMCDYCALSPVQRAALLSRFEGLLADGGHVVLDVYALGAFNDKREVSYYEKNQLNGFWSGEPYYAFVSSFKYDVEKVSLDKYTIVEANRQREVYNWLQYFTPETLGQEALAAGLEIAALYGDVSGKAYEADSAEFAAVLKRAE